MNISEKIKELETKIFKTNNNSQKHFILAKYLELLENPELSFFILDDGKSFHFISRRLTHELYIRKQSQNKRPFGLMLGGTMVKEVLKKFQELESEQEDVSPNILEAVNKAFWDLL